MVSPAGGQTSGVVLGHQLVVQRKEAEGPPDVRVMIATPGMGSVGLRGFKKSWLVVRLVFSSGCLLLLQVLGDAECW